MKERRRDGKEGGERERQKWARRKAGVRQGGKEGKKERMEGGRKEGVNRDPNQLAVIFQDLINLYHIKYLSLERGFYYDIPFSLLLVCEPEGKQNLGSESKMKIYG